MVHSHPALHGDLKDLAGRCGLIEFGVQADTQGTETPDTGLTRDEISVARMLHRALACLPRERRVAVIVEIDRSPGEVEWM